MDPIHGNIFDAFDNCSSHVSCDINRRLERVMKRKRDNTSFYTFCEYQRINCSTAFFIPKRHRVAHFVSNFVALAIFALFFVPSAAMQKVRSPQIKEYQL